MSDVGRLGVTGAGGRARPGRSPLLALWVLAACRRHTGDVPVTAWQLQVQGVGSRHVSGCSQTPLPGKRGAHAGCRGDPLMPGMPGRRPPGAGSPPWPRLHILTSSAGQGRCLTVRSGVMATAFLLKVSANTSGFKTQWIDTSSLRELAGWKGVQTHLWLPKIRSAFYRFPF